jgi:hypothetical protein
VVVTVRMTDEWRDHLEAMAKSDVRSLSQEVLFLIGVGIDALGRPRPAEGKAEERDDG